VLHKKKQLMRKEMYEVHSRPRSGKTRHFPFIF